MNFLYVLFSAVMFLDCVFLVFLVLLQLPKKETGAGMAFGGGATDALFGAGSGNVLTKITKYAAGVFFGLALIMAIVTANMNRPKGSELLNALGERPSTSKAIPPSSSPGLLTNVPALQPATNMAAPQTPATSTNPSGTPSAPGLLSLP